MRLRFRYSLLLLLVVITAVAVWLASEVHRANTQAIAVAAIEELGGSVETESRAPKWIWTRFGSRYDSRVVRVVIPFNKVQSAVPQLRSFPSLKIADINIPCTIDPSAGEISATEDRIRRSYPDVKVRSFASLIPPPIGRITIVEEDEETLGVPPPP